MVIALGSVIALPALAQQQTAPNPQMQDEADKGKGQLCKTESLRFESRC